MRCEACGAPYVGAGLNNVRGKRLSVCNDCWNGSPHCLKCGDPKPIGAYLKFSLKCHCPRCSRKDKNEKRASAQTQVEA